MSEVEIGLLGILTDIRKISLDVGANIGAYTRALLPLSREVHFFEPLPDLSGQLTELCDTNPTAHYYPCAASNRLMSVELRIPNLLARGHWGPLATIEDANNLGGREFRRVRIIACPLDLFGFSDVGFMKIDVEGHELSVLEGARNLLEQYHPNLLIEAEVQHRPNAVATVSEFLSDLGYVGCFRSDEWDRVRPISEFDPAKHQSAGALHSLRYAGNFIFGTSRDLMSEVETVLKASGLPGDFDASRYLALNPDVAKAGMAAADHYMLYGRMEGRRWA